MIYWSLPSSISKMEIPPYIFLRPIEQLMVLYQFQASISMDCATTNNYNQIFENNHITIIRPHKLKSDIITLFNVAVVMKETNCPNKDSMR